MRYAILNQNDKVLNIAIANAAFAADKPNWVLATDTADIGDTYNRVTQVFSKPTPNANQARRAIKQTVRDLLRRTDWTQVPDNLGAARQQLWKDWRVSLRGLIVAAQTDPFNIVFPDPPGDIDEDGL